MGPQWAEIDRLSKSIKDLEKRLTDLRESKSVFSEIMNDADDQLEVWDKLKDELEEGKTVFAPTSGSSSKKRKARGTDNSRKKRRAVSHDDSDDNSIEREDGDYEDEDSESEAELSEENQDPLTEEQISSKILEIKTNKKKARQEKAEIAGKVETLVAEIKASKVRDMEMASNYVAVATLVTFH